MEPDSIARKTEKGVLEIETRANKLPYRKRSLLILVDGVRSVRDLITQFHFPEAAQSLQELADEGYIEAKVAAAPSRATPTVVAAPLADAAEFENAVRALSRVLYDTIGPAADKVTARLEAARDRDSFIRAWQSCSLMAESTVGKKRAEALNERAAAIVNRFLQG